jgi:hypothetical protein
MIRILYPIFTFLFLSLLCLRHLQAAPDTLVLTKASQSYFDYIIDNRNAEIFHDSTNQYSAEEITASSFQKNFSNALFPDRYDPSVHKTFWIKTTISNRGAKNLKWLFLQGDPSIGNIEFYAPQDNVSNYKNLGEGGLLSPFNSRTYNMISMVFDLPLDSEETKTFYIKMNSSTNFAFKMVVQDSKLTMNYFLQEYYFLGFYYGMLLLMALYNLIIYFSIRDKVYIYYVLYVLATSILNAMNDKTAFQFLWPSHPVLNMVVYYIGQPAYILFLTLYSVNFLSIKNNFPVYYKFLLYSTTVLIVYQLSDTLWLHTGIENYIIIAPLAFIYFVAFKSLLAGYSPARFFILGFTFILSGMAIFILATKDILPVNLFTVYAYNAGVVAETIILSRAIGDRFKYIKESKEETDKKLIAQLKENEELKNKITIGLEEKVKERTAYIEMQAEEIKRMNELLKEDNKVLNNNVTKINQSRVMQEDINYEEFIKIYPDEEACLKFMEMVKWKNEFVCTKCKNTSYNTGPAPYSRKCTRCRTIESVTAHTILHGLKFPINKALYIILTTTNNANKYTTEQLSEILDLRQATCWTFQNKVKQRITAINNPKKGKINWVSLITEIPSKK